MEITLAIPALGRCRDPASPSWSGLRLDRTVKNGWKKAPCLIPSSLRLPVLGQQGTAKLPAFALGEQAAMPWCSLLAGLVLCPHSWLWVCPTPCQGAKAVQQMDALKSSSLLSSIAFKWLGPLPSAHERAQLRSGLLPALAGRAGPDTKQKSAGGAGTGGQGCHLRWSPQQEGRLP